MRHVDSDDLLRYRVEPSLLDDPLLIAAHLETCDACGRELAAIDEEERALRDELTWSIVVAAGAPPSARLQEILALRRRMDRENALARRLLDKLLRPSFRLLEARIAARPAFQHAGTVRVLCETARQFHEKRPATALDIATVAYEVAGKLPEDATMSRQVCMAFAQRERATALRYLGQMKNALEALEEADARFNENPAADTYDKAIVQMSRAYVLVDMGRFDEAAVRAAEARQTFRGYADASRELAVSMVEARCLIEVGRLSEAVEICDSVVAVARREGNLDLLARGLLNAGVTYRRIRDFVKAEERVFEAIPLFDQLRLHTEVARANLQLAIITVDRGNLRYGIELLAASEAELAEAGLANESALATLWWAEASLALGARDGVAEKCNRLVLFYESEGATRRARLALAYLQECLRSEAATPKVVAEVREFIERLPRNPAAPFAPSA